MSCNIKLRQSNSKTQTEILLNIKKEVLLKEIEDLNKAYKKNPNSQIKKMILNRKKELRMLACLHCDLV